MFFDTTTEARQAGYRACKRCQPDGQAQGERYAGLVADACRTIETAETMPALAEVAANTGLSPFHFHRIFRKETGLTPKEYADAHRADRVRRVMNDSPSVTDAIYDAGYNSSGRFYEGTSSTLGMRPADFRDHGAGTRIRFAVGESSLGSVLVAATGRGICAIRLGDDPDALVRELEDQFGNAELVGADAAFEQSVATVIGFVEHPASGLDLPLDVRGSAFQHRVWQALRTIPYGETVSYTGLARRIGNPHAARVVAQACATNSVAIAIPCHRVVRTDGNLGGYRWGIERKATLLAQEGHAMPGQVPVAT